MAKWEYIGKREILHWMSSLGYPVESGKFCNYAKFEGMEWLENTRIKNCRTTWRGLATDHVQKQAKDAERRMHTYVRYNSNTYTDIY